MCLLAQSASLYGTFPHNIAWDVEMLVKSINKSYKMLETISGNFGQLFLVMIHMLTQIFQILFSRTKQAVTFLFGLFDPVPQTHLQL